jgi:hypothetical protein
VFVDQETGHGVDEADLAELVATGTERERRDYLQFGYCYGWVSHRSRRDLVLQGILASD